MVKIKHTKKNIYAPRIGIASYARHHGQALWLSLKKIVAAPIASLLTFLVVAFAIAIPLMLYVILINTQTVIKDWQTTQITVYLKKDTTLLQGQQLLQKLQQNPRIKHTKFISADQGLKDFESNTGLSNILVALRHNPLPDVIEVFFDKTLLASPEKVELLLHELRAQPEIESVQLDIDWVKKMHTLTAFVEQVVLILAAILGAGVLLIIVNTIRFISHTANDEIRVIKLIGGSKAYICRPYLYMGFIYGIGGGALAILAVFVMLTKLAAAIKELSPLFTGYFELQNFNGLLIVQILAVSASLGYLSAWLSMRSQVRNTEI